MKNLSENKKVTELGYNNKRIDISIDPLTRLHVFRIAQFLRDLLKALNEDTQNWEKIIDRAIYHALNLRPIKKKFKLTLYELGLVSFWISLIEAGISKFSLPRLILIARKNLRKRIMCKRILNVLSFLRHIKYSYNVEGEVMYYVKSALREIFNHPYIKNKLNQPELIERYRVEILDEIDKIISELYETMNLSGFSRRVIAACCLYIADKIVCNKLDIKPLLSARIIAQVLGINQFTILRKYRIFKNALGMKD